jgi:hypothetical protein
VDDPKDTGKRDRLVSSIDAVIRRDPWLAPRVGGRGQNGAVFIDVTDPISPR